MRVESCLSFAGAEDALENAALARDPYRFVLCEYKLGDVEGKDFMEWVKAKAFAPKPYVLVLTAFGQTAGTELATMVGFSGYFLKPFYPDHIKGAMQLLLESESEGEPMPLVTRPLVVSMAQTARISRKVQPDMFPGVKALVVEDMKINQMLIVKILEKHGCEVKAVENGREAVNVVQVQSFDIIFMDCQMPEMDGFEATQPFALGRPRRAGIFLLLP